MRRRYKLMALLMVCAMCLTVVGCNEISKTSDGNLAAQTEKSMAEMNRQVGMPAIKNFQERKLAKMIFELRDQENLICYAYVVNLNGDLIFIGKCIGFGLPYSVQYTSPKKMVNRYGGQIDSTMHDPHIMPQADPNGLFMPSGLSATWLMMIDSKTGDARPVYCEPQIIVSPFKLH